jgi:hypothetical protein
MLDSISGVMLFAAITLPLALIAALLIMQWGGSSSR